MQIVAYTILLSAAALLGSFFLIAPIAIAFDLNDNIFKFIAKCAAIGLSLLVIGIVLCLIFVHPHCR